MTEPTQGLEQAEIGEIFDRLRDEVRASTGDGGRRGTGAEVRPPAARREAKRHWAVTAERPYLFLPGAWGRTRGLALLPLKAVLRRLMRWYVEPVAADQRAFNSAMLRLTDELTERLADLDERLRRLEEAAPDRPPDAPRR